MDKAAPSPKHFVSKESLEVAREPEIVCYSLGFRKYVSNCDLDFVVILLA